MDALVTVESVLTTQSISDMLVETVASRLARHVRPYQLRREIEETLSKLTKNKRTIRLSQDSFDELLGKAQQFLINRSGENPQSMALKQIGFLQDVIADEVDLRLQLVANAQLTELVGTAAKNRSEMHEPGSVGELTRKMLEELEDLVED